MKRKMTVAGRIILFLAKEVCKQKDKWQESGTQRQVRLLQNQEHLPIQLHRSLQIRDKGKAKSTAGGLITKFMSKKEKGVRVTYECQLKSEHWHQTTSVETGGPSAKEK